MPKSEVQCLDNMEYMAQFPDKFFNLLILDPPYGIKADKMQMGSGKNKKYKKSESKGWDTVTPRIDYFEEARRISRNQIIWGGNYFVDKLPISRGWIFWDKGINGESSFADGELAWTSFDTVLRKADVRYKGFLGADQFRIHETQKPISLYKWCLKNYANPGDRIGDFNLGSQSSRIAAYDMGFDFYGCEISPVHFKNGCDRFENHINQSTIYHLFPQ